MTERWLPIPGYEDLYEVSNVGRVKRSTGGRGSVAGRILTNKRASNGYYHVDLSRSDVKTRFGVHRLVAMAFLGVPSNAADLEVNHKDGNKRNNAPENLEWCTSLENNRHARVTGLCLPRPQPRGELNPNSKITQTIADEIRRLKGVDGARVIASRYGVSRTLVQLIHQEKLWPPGPWPREFPAHAIDTCGATPEI